MTRDKSLPPKQSKAQRQMSANERAAEAARMRAMRLPYRVIADRLGYANPSSAKKACDRALKSVLREAGEELRKAELESLDIAEAALAPKLLKGSKDAVDSMIKIKNHRARLTGLYEPVKENVTVEIRNAITSMTQGLTAVFEGEEDYGREFDGDETGGEDETEG